VQDWFAFSSKVNSIKEHLNVEKKKKESKKQKFGRRRDTIRGRLDQKSDAVPTEL
jgi:hypothetical protein